jgi:UDP-N-acetylmuramoylalanine--D-glutamate ligase
MADDMFDLIIGLGISGLSAVRYLHGQKVPLRVMDSRAQAPGQDELGRAFPDVKLHLGSFRADWAEQARRLIVSPGVSLDEAVIAAAIASGKEVIGDIELFARVADKPIAAVTGSNAKSTVTTLLAEAINACGVAAQAGGNLSPPALDLLGSEADVYVLELSSFQLETTESLRARVAAILNVSADHLDRHHSMTAYVAAKQRIYDGCEVAVWNRDDEVTRPPAGVARQLSFGVHPEADFCLDVETGMLRVHGEAVLPMAELIMPGHHNALNVLAVLAMGEALELPLAPMLATAKGFAGLPHRCQRVAEHEGVVWIDDSKGTNVGATLAAIKGVGSTIKGRILLLAGGQGKGQDFSPLATTRAYIRCAVLFGEDADQLARGLGEDIEKLHVTSLTEAVVLASRRAQVGDAVLLSPACASFDMFANYVDRGEQFVRQVQEVTHG